MKVGKFLEFLLVVLALSICTNVGASRIRGQVPPDTEADELEGMNGSDAARGDQQLDPVRSGEDMLEDQPEGIGQQIEALEQASEDSNAQKESMVEKRNDESEGEGAHAPEAGAASEAAPAPEDQQTKPTENTAEAGSHTIVNPSPGISITNENCGACPASSFGSEGAGPSNGPSSPKGMEEVKVAILELYGRAKKVNIPVPELGEVRNSDEANKALDILESAIREHPETPPTSNESFREKTVTSLQATYRHDESLPRFVEKGDDDALAEAQEVEDEAGEREGELDKSEEELETHKESDEEEERENEKKMPKKKPPTQDEARKLLRNYSLAIEHIVNDLVSAHTGVEDLLGSKERYEIMKNAPPKAGKAAVPEEAGEEEAEGKAGGEETEGKAAGEEESEAAGEEESEAAGEEESEAAGEL